MFQEHSNTSTAPSGGHIRSHHHWLHGDVGRNCRGEGEGQGQGEGKKVTVMWDVNTTEEAGNQLPKRLANKTHCLVDSAISISDTS